MKLRSGWGIIARWRPLGEQRAAMPEGEPLGLKGYCSVVVPLGSQYLQGRDKHGWENAGRQQWWRTWDRSRQRDLRSLSALRAAALQASQGIGTAAGNGPGPQQHPGEGVT